MRDRIDFSSRLPIYEDSKTNKRKRAENKSDVEHRKEIQKRIRELKKLGYPKEETLIKISSEYSDSKYRGFFMGWVENAYKEKKNRGFDDDILKDLDERM